MTTDQKLNCWQYKNCGREKGGLLAEVLGECPAASEMRYDGINDGRGAGRVCWALAGTTCQGASAGRAKSCCTCDFYRRVVFEEADGVSCRYSSVIG
jgi:hypothetical protein